MKASLRCSMNFTSASSMEEIPLEDEDRTSVEYRVLMAYAQRRLSASKYGELLERGAKGQEGSSLTRQEAQGVTPTDQGKAPQEKLPEDLKPLAKRKSQKKKTRQPHWKRFLVLPCLRGQTEEDPGKSEVNGKLPEFQSGAGRDLTTFSTETQEDSDITRVADKLAELVDNSRSRSKTIEGRGLVRTLSLEEDGGWASKIVPEGAPKAVPQGSSVDDGKDDEEKIIGTIVALLRKSGDELEKEMEKDNTFRLNFRDLISYSFFRRIINQFLEEVPVDPTKDSEAHVQSTKVAYVMEVTTKLTAVDNHPMNLVLGFGTKYLKENFRPWFHSHGGWEKALGVSNQEEVE
ncbi:apoptosis facilitator Bcl-2-like protein 14 isoform X2 [Heteronotia binoei]|uniref:apoptosis facilitator Bcl-2-like protein 14 isoform X2 n=1 Tax=Heteronotia binoei TaxID=13085 RepID=UPI00292E2152|nr:apoptosis facilitator Bcl-2-like protein 14 isoform X2 [Heteronotia binoei]